jgi:drug/metabolite transporter (DMT)-like permease
VTVVDAPAGAGTRGTGAATAALVVVTAIWGSTFVVTKDATEGFALLSFLTWRFGIAAVVLTLLALPAWRRTPAVTVRRGAVVGLYLGAGFIAQTWGLQLTSAAVSGFITGLMVVLTPLVALVVYREPVPGRAWIGVGVATLGLGLLALQGLSLSPGALLTLLGAVFFAFQIASLATWAEPADALVLTAVQVLVAASMCAVAALVVEGGSPPQSREEWTAVLYLALVATSVGFLVQTWSQAHLTATRAAVVMTLEPVFAAVIAVLVAGEQLGLRELLGGALVIAAMAIVELGARHGRDAALPRVECC